MGDENPSRTLGDYSKPSHEGYQNTIELPNPNQHLKDFLKLVDSLDLDVANKERTRLRLFQFSLPDQASNWLECLPAGSISTWEDLTTQPRFASQVDVNNDLSKPVTTHYLPKERESAIVKPHHVIASSESRNSSKNMPRFSSNDMVHNHYLDEARKKTQEKVRNSEPSVMPSAKSQSTANDIKPKPRINNQKSRNWHESKTSYITTKIVPIAAHSRNSRNFSDTKHFVCSTWHKCVFNANHDHCVTKFLTEVNLCAKIPTWHRFSIKKTSVVHEKTMTPRSCLRWKPMGRIFKIVGLRWVPTGMIFTSSTTTVDSEPPHGSNTDITNLHECIQTLDSSARTSINVQEEQNLSLGAGTPSNLKKERIKACIKRKCDIWETNVTWDIFDTRDIC
ncbi:hypothetical protein Tco_0751086 [Tanacetum coccineum]|uniref:MAK10-like protein n=1 Tax=Tanacetum coccineum TaxID=301880 RepID=A0ABQ4Z407_9ASTR